MNFAATKSKGNSPAEAALLKEPWDLGTSCNLPPLREAGSECSQVSPVERGIEGVRSPTLGLFCLFMNSASEGQVGDSWDTVKPEKLCLTLGLKSGQAGISGSNWSIHISLNLSECEGSVVDAHFIDETLKELSKDTVPANPQGTR
jgi:hypothetical protein